MSRLLFLCLFGAALPTMPEERLVTVYTASHGLPSGTIVQDSDIVKRQLHESLLSPGMMQDPKALVGRVTSARILEGEFLREERLVDLRAGRGVSAVIPTGLVAINVEFVEPSSQEILTFLEPGISVDLVAKDRDTVVQGGRILRVEPTTRGYYANLLVSPKDATRIAGRDDLLIALRSNCFYWMNTEPSYPTLEAAVRWERRNQG